MHRASLLLSAVAFIAFSLTSPVWARLGVGVGIGIIEVDEPLYPGGIYRLPPLSVFNTGDETADYRMSVTFHEDQPEKRPAPEWFHYSPSEFRLEPGKAQTVEIEIQMPLRAEPGPYFAYLEAGPLQTVESGESTVALAAATKLSFDVEAANIWWALYYKALALWRENAPWTYVAVGFISLSVIVIFMRGRFSLKPRKIKLT